MFEVEMERHPCKFCEERHKGCHGNYHGSGEPCPRYAKASQRNEEIKATERNDAAIRGILCLPRDEWKKRGKKLRNERLRLEGKIK